MIDGQRDLGDALLSDEQLGDELARTWRAIMRGEGEQPREVREQLALRYVALVTEREIRLAERAAQSA